MVLPSLLASPAASLSSPRYRPRTSTATATSSRRRPAVVLYVTGESSSLWVGSTAKPQRLIPLQNVAATTFLTDASANITTNMEDAYRYWAAVLHAVYYQHHWDGNATDRPVVVVLPDVSTVLAEDLNDTVTAQAIQRVLLETLGVPGVYIVPVLAMIPMALPMLPTFLCVYTTTTDAACFVHAHGQTLPYTLHTIPLLLRNDKVDNDEPSLDAYDPLSLLVAVGHTLLACPLAVRRAAVQHLVILTSGGNTRLSNNQLAVRLGRSLRRVLQEASATDSTASPPRPYPHTVQMVAVDWTVLQPLAEYVRVVDVGNSIHQHPCTDDLVAWLGATVWAAQQGDDSSCRG